MPESSRCYESRDGKNRRKPDVGVCFYSRVKKCCRPVSIVQSFVAEGWLGYGKEPVFLSFAASRDPARAIKRRSGTLMRFGPVLRLGNGNKKWKMGQNVWERLCPPECERCQKRYGTRTWENGECASLKRRRSYAHLLFRLYGMSGTRNIGQPQSVL